MKKFLSVLTIPLTALAVLTGAIACRCWCGPSTGRRFRPWISPPAAA